MEFCLFDVRDVDQAKQGRGFAVVASEMRHMAQHSATAAKEIDRLISDSTDEVANGAWLVRR